MISNTIHYCWFSQDKYPKSIQHCIDTWKRVMPDYKIKCWDGNSFDFDSLPFTKEAMSVKQYAAAADYVRLYALYTEGGIYLDSDVEVFKPFAPFLNCEFFCGTEAFDYMGKVQFDMEAAIMGSIKGHPFLKECMFYYENTHFIKEDGSYDNVGNVMPKVISRIAEKYGYQYQDKEQHLTNAITVYPTTIFINNLYLNGVKKVNPYAIHRNAASWMDFEHRGKLFHFCRKHDLMGIYHWIEKKGNNK